MKHWTWTIRVQPMSHRNGYLAHILEEPETLNAEEAVGNTPEEALGNLLFRMSCQGGDPLTNCTLDITNLDDPIQVEP